MPTRRHSKKGSGERAAKRGPVKYKDTPKISKDRIKHVQQCISFLNALELGRVGLTCRTLHLAVTECLRYGAVGTLEGQWARPPSPFL